MVVDPAPYIDHTLLDNTATYDRLEQLCAEAVSHRFASVCIYPYFVKQARELLHRQQVRVGTVIGFPSGMSTSPVKLYEAEQAIVDGAQELDVVLNLGMIKDGNSEALYRDIAPICEDTSVLVKAILEMPLLSAHEWEMAIDVCLAAGVSYLKTCTGWRGGVTLEQVQLLASLCKGKAGIKASGGIRSWQQAQALLEAGASRLGTSNGIAIVREFTSQNS